MINLDEQLKDVRTVAIAGHVRPDGDAFGSCMGMYLFLRTYYPQIDFPPFVLWRPKMMREFSIILDAATRT